MNILKFLRGTWWGTGPETLITLYKSFVRSIIDYASFVYFPLQKNQIHKLEKIQFRAIRLALGYRLSTPTNILLAESKLLAIKERAKFLGNCYLHKILSNRQLLMYETINCLKKKMSNSKYKNSKSLLFSIIKNLSKDCEHIYTDNHYNMYTCEYKIITSDININVKFGNTLYSSHDPNIAINSLIQEENAIGIYTDGSKSNSASSVGSACVCKELGVIPKISICKKASIFTAESLALLEAVKIATTFSNNNYIIFSDSLNVLVSLKKS